MNPIPKPVEVSVSLASVSVGNRHRLNELHGYFVDVRVACDILKTTAGDATITASLMNNTLGVALHTRTVTLRQNIWKQVDLFGLVERIDQAAELQVVLSASVANLEYKLTAIRHVQRGG